MSGEILSRVKIIKNCRITIGVFNQAGTSSASFRLTCSDDCPDGEEQFLFTIKNYNQITKGVTVNILDSSLTSLASGKYDNRNVQPVLGLCAPVNKAYKVTGANLDK